MKRQRNEWRRRKTYARKDIILWFNDCFDCCMECELFDSYKDSCCKEHITCNQCEYGGEIYGE